MHYLFNDQAYPIVAKAHEIAPLLSRTDVRAVAYRNPAISKSLATLKEGITAENNADIAHRYKLSPQQDKREMAAGRTLYLEPFKISDISTEASLAGITINPDILELLTSRTNAMREIFTKVILLICRLLENLRKGWLIAWDPYVRNVRQLAGERGDLGALFSY